MKNSKDEPSTAIVNQPDPAQDLRTRAEEKFRTLEDFQPEALEPDELQRLVHELRVHQIKLEMQNEKLRCDHAELETSMSRFVDLYDYAPVGYVTISEAGLILEANLTAAILLGVVRSELVRQQMSRFILREDQDIYFRHRKLLFETGAPQRWDLRMLKADSRPFWALMDATLMQDDERGFPVCRVLVSDITERKLAEQEKVKLEAQLRQAQKLESIGSLAGGIAHDLNNILFPISGLSEMLLDEIPTDSPVYESIEQIYKSAQRGSDLVKQILAFSRQSNHQKLPIRIQPILKEVLNLIRSTIPTNIEITSDIESNCGLVSADPTQVHQILMNLITNAYHAVEQTGQFMSS